MAKYVVYNYLFSDVHYSPAVTTPENNRNLLSIRDGGRKGPDIQNGGGPSLSTSYWARKVTVTVTPPPKTSPDFDSGIKSFFFLLRNEHYTLKQNLYHTKTIIYDEQIASFIRLPW